MTGFRRGGWWLLLLSATAPLGLAQEITGSDDDAWERRVAAVKSPTQRRQLHEEAVDRFAQDGSGGATLRTRLTALWQNEPTTAVRSSFDHDWDQLAHLTVAGRLDDVATLAEALTALYAPWPLESAWIALDHAQGLLLTGRLDAGEARLDEAVVALDGWVLTDKTRRLDHSRYVEARVTQAQHRSQLALQRGSPEAAEPALREAMRWTEEAPAGLLDPNVIGETRRLLFNLLLARDQFAALESEWNKLDQATWLLPAMRDRLAIRLALGRTMCDLRGTPSGDGQPGGVESFEALFDAWGDLEGSRLADITRDDLWTATTGHARALLAEEAIDDVPFAFERGLELRERVYGDSPLTPREELDRAILVLRASFAAFDPDPDALSTVLSTFPERLRTWASLASRPDGVGWLHFDETALAFRTYLDALAEDGAPASAMADAVLRLGECGSLAKALGSTAGSTPTSAWSTLAPTHGALLSLHPGPESSTWLIATKDGIERLEFDVSAIELERARDQIARAIQDLLRVDRFDLAATLDVIDRRSSLVVPTALSQRMAAWKAVTFTGLDQLGYLPFEILLANGQRIGDRLAVTYLPSVVVGHQLSQRRANGDRQGTGFVVAVDAKSAGDLRAAPLPFETPERTLLFGSVKSAEHSIEHGNQATAEALRTLASRVDVLHVVAHEARLSDRGRPQGLQLASGPFGPTEAETLAAPPLCILTACRTWRAPFKRGDDGRASLAGALLLAGARTVVLSATDVDYQASLRFGGHLHSALTRGAPVSVALLEARQAYVLAEKSHGTERLLPYLVHAVGLGHR